MKLFVSAVLIFGLTWTRTEPSQVPRSEECSSLDSPLSLEDKTQVLGRFHFLVGFTEGVFYKKLLVLTSSYWFNISETSTGLRLNQFTKMDGTCVRTDSNAMVVGNSATVSRLQAVTQFQFLNFSGSSLVLSINSRASNVHRFLPKLRPHLGHTNLGDLPPNLESHCLYLISREPVLKDSDLLKFRVLARCAGFRGEPDFVYSGQHEYCSEEESVLIAV